MSAVLSPPDAGLKTILLTFDVEDWFQVENLRPVHPSHSWDDCRLRVERNTHRILDILDSLPESTATFFVLGWIAERVPGLIREILERGHEVASHGYNHVLCSTLSEQELIQDLSRSKSLLEDLIGAAVDGYRAPSFTVCSELLSALQHTGYAYDSSYNSFAGHQRYGRLELHGRPSRNGLYRVSDSLLEVPVSNLRIMGRTLPWAGGGYFRLFPELIFRGGVASILNRDRTYVFYMHPWEVDPGQPRAQGLTTLPRFKHYVNLKKTAGRLERLIEKFRDCRFLSCREYIQEAGV